MMTISQLFFLNFSTYVLLMVATLVPGSSYQAWLPYGLIAFSFPHFMATYWVWLRRIDSWKAEWWPLAVVPLYTLLFTLSAKNLIPVRTEHFVKAIYLYLIYHFARQLYGATVWQSLKQGLSLARWEKFILEGFFLCAALYGFFDLETRGATDVLFYHPTRAIRIPWSVQAVFLSATILFLILITARFLQRYFSSGDLKILAPLLSVSLGVLWFVPPMSHQMIFFLPMAHALQYLPFIRIKTTGMRPLSLGLFLVFLLFTGWLLFRFLPFRVSPGLLPGGLWPVFLLTLLNLHHFVIDGRIWKLRDSRNADLLTSSYRENA